MTWLYVTVTARHVQYFHCNYFHFLRLLSNYATTLHQSVTFAIVLQLDHFCKYFWLIFPLSKHRLIILYFLGRRLNPDAFLWSLGMGGDLLLDVGVIRNHAYLIDVVVDRLQGGHGLSFVVGKATVVVWPVSAMPSNGYNNTEYYETNVQSL